MLQYAVQNQITIKHDNRAYRGYRNNNRSKRKIITRANNEILRPRGNKQTLYNT